ncbi:MAG TPA: hypothetical protein VGX37_02635 [Allosphingosinicella sp.]|nr:hypothetical protein [Allosphingosinicella sp.]
MGAIEDQARGAAGRVGSAFAGIGTNVKSAADSFASFERGQQAANRLLASIDPLFAAQLRYNAAMDRANELQAQGMLTGQRYMQVIDALNDEFRRSITVQDNLNAVRGRGGMVAVQASQQFQDFFIQVAGGQSVLLAGTQQLSQMMFVLQSAGGGASSFARFMGSGWVAGIMAGVAVLGLLIPKLLDTEDAAEKATRELEENARQAEATRIAQEAFSHTLPGIEAAIRSETQALEEQNRTLNQNQQLMLNRARAHLADLERQQSDNAGEQAQALEALTRARQHAAAVAGSPQEGAAAAAETRVRQAEERLAQLREQNARIQADIASATREIRLAEMPIDQREVEASLDAVTAATNRYREALGRLNDERANDNISREEYRRRLRLIEQQRDRETDAAREAQRQHSDGVSRFRSREQAIGVAGRELLRQGFRVEENQQFGGVHGNHPGMGNSAHGRFAIDVNAIAGNEADVPDLRARFDELARRYQARGYRVLWNGQVYEAGGNGPSGPIRHGDAHRDHMHLEAPQTIVGRPTQSAGESAEIRQDNLEVRQLERRSEIVRQMEAQTAQMVEQSRLGAMRSQGLDQEAELQERLNERVREFNQRMEEFRKRVRRRTRWRRRSGSRRDCRTSWRSMRTPRLPTIDCWRCTAKTRSLPMSSVPSWTPPLRPCSRRLREPARWASPWRTTWRSRKLRCAPTRTARRRSSKATKPSANANRVSRSSAIFRKSSNASWMK